MKFKVNKCLEFHNKILISIFFKYVNQLIQLVNYVENEEFEYLNNTLIISKTHAIIQ